MVSESCLKDLVNASWLVPFFPFFSFALIGLFTIRQRMISALISLIGIFLSFLVSLGIFAMRVMYPGTDQFSIPWISIGSFQIEIGYLVDNLSSMMVLVVSLVAFLIQLYSVGYMEEEKDSGFSRYFAYMSLFAAAMLGLVLSNNFLEIYICWELVGLGSYLLIGFWYQKKSAADAAKKAFVVTRFGDLGFLIGIIMISWASQSFNFLEIWTKIPELLKVGLPVGGFALLVFCGAVGKSAQFPLQVWLPDAMEGPTPVSALIHAATMVAAGVYLVARCFPLFHAAPEALLVVAYIGAITAFMAATMGVVQNDIKRVLAYSTISQLGYMMLALGVGASTAAIFHLMTHAFFKALLFLCAGSAIHALHTNDIWEMGGLGKIMRITGITFLVGCLALSGIPPASGFFSKDEILTTVWHSSHLILKILAFAVVFLTAFYMFRVYMVAFCGRLRAQAEPHESRPVMTVPLVILAIFAAIVGFVGAPGMNYFGNFIKFEGTHEKVEGIATLLSNYGMWLSLLLSVLGIATAYSLYREEPAKNEEMLRRRFKAIYTVLENKYWMDDFWGWIVRQIVFTLGRIASFIDENLIDGAVNAVGAFTAQFGEYLRREQSGLVQQYALLFLISVVVMFIGLGLIEQNFIMSIMHLFGQ